MTTPAAALTDLLPAERFLTGPDRDGWSVAGRVPGAVAMPVSDEEAAAVLERASEEGLSVVPAGQGTFLAGPESRSAPDLVISTALLTRVTEYEPADLTLTAEAGVTLGALGAATGANGQWLPLDPPDADGGSLGGLLATGAAGPLQAEFGTPRDHVLGLTLVTGDGRVLEVGGRVVKNVAGYDLVRLAVGSGGALGLITRATVRLHPVPEADVALLLRGSSLEALAGASSALATAPVSVSSLELAEPDPASGSGALLAARLVGPREAVEYTRQVLEDELAAVGAGSPESFGGPAVADFFEKLTRPERGGLLLRLALLPGRLGELVGIGRELVKTGFAEETKKTVAVHVTRGRLRIAVEEPPTETPVNERLAAATLLARERLEIQGGSLRVLAGPATFLSQEAASRTAAPGVGRLLQGIKTAFDPAGILPLTEGVR